MSEPHTLIIGDEIGRGLYDALQKIPGTGAIWQNTTPQSSIDFWANAMGDLPKYLDRLAAGPEGGFPPDKLPDTAIVSLGRGEIQTEPTDKPSPDDVKRMVADIGKIVDGLRASKLKVLWVLPPGTQNEGTYRSVIEKTLGDKQVRVFPTQHSFVDPQNYRRNGEEHAITTETLDQMAALLATWAPLGAPRVPVGPRHPAPELVSGFFANLSKPAKLGLAAAVVAALGGAAYAGWRKYG